MYENKRTDKTNMTRQTFFHRIIITVLLLLGFTSTIFSQDFFQTYKSSFLEPYQKTSSTPDKADDKIFFQEQIKILNNYNPPSLQRFIAKQIITLTENDSGAQKECLDAGLFLAQKNWLRGNDKIDLLKRLDKIGESYQSTLKFDKKPEKNETFKTCYRIELDIVEEYLSLLKYDDAKAFYSHWLSTAENVRDQRINNSLGSECLRIKTKITNYKKLGLSLSNLKEAPNSATFKKSIAMSCLFYLFSPESALSFLEGTTFTDEINMLTAFSKLLNKQGRFSKAPYFFSDRDLSLPPPILFERLSRIQELQTSVEFIKEKFDDGESQYFHHARDMTREMIQKNLDNTALDEKQLINFFTWLTSIINDENLESQLFFLYQLKPKLIDAKAEMLDPQNLIAYNKIETTLLDKITDLEKKLKLSKFRFPAPPADEENEKEKQWLSKPIQERNRIIDSMQEKIRKANPNADKQNFWIDSNTLTLNIPNDCQIDNLTPFKEIPFKHVYMNQTGNIADFSFLKDSPVISIEAFWCGLKSLSGLKNMKTLRFLNIHGNRIHDLSELKGLSITNLNIGNTLVKDISPLKFMPLTDLNIERTGIISLNSLEYMPLTNLNANDCKFLNDIDALENSNIRILRLDRCEPIRSLEALSKSQLRELYIENTAVSDLSPISKCLLTHLYFSKCPNIKSIGEISMMSIENLGLNNHLFIPHIIKYEFPLKSLRLAGTNIQDLSALKFFEELNTLDLSDCDMLRDLRTIKNPSLNALIINNCKFLRVFTGIAETNIKYISANNSEMRDLTTLANSKVEKLDIIDSELVSLKGVSQFPLRELNARESKKLKDIVDVENSLLEVLLLIGTPVKNVDSIRKIKKLRDCDID
jgi:Leucine-rich repeat (LRR) protein